MSSLTITETAANLIRNEVARSAIPKPVVYLLVQSDPMRVPAELGRAILGGADDSTIRSLSTKYYGESLLSDRRRLLPTVYSRDLFPNELLVEFYGIAFFFPPEIKDALDGGILDLGEEGLILTDANGTVVMPRNVK